MQVASVLRDPVTTTDELIPSGETSSYRSNPLKLAEFTLSPPGSRIMCPAPRPSQALETARRAGEPDPPKSRPRCDKLALVGQATAG